MESPQNNSPGLAPAAGAAPAAQPTITTPEGARERIEALKQGADPAFVKALMDPTLRPGHPVEREYDRLSRLAASDAHEVVIHGHSLSPEQAEELTALTQPPACPDDYDPIPYHLGRELNPDEIEMDKSFRAWGHAAGLPSGAFSELAEVAQRESTKILAMTPAEREAHRGEVLQRLEHQYGQGLGEKLELAEKLISELESARPGLKIWLQQQSGLSDSLPIIGKFIQTATRRYGSSR